MDPILIDDKHFKKNEESAKKALSREISFDDRLDFCALNMDLSNREQVADEVMALNENMIGLGISDNWYINRDDFPQLGPGYAYENYELKNPSGQHVKGKNSRNMWQAMNLTWSDEHKNPSHVSVSERQDSAQMNWKWNPGFQLSETQKLIAQLHPEKLLTVRAMLMPAGHLGFFHIDGNNLWAEGYQQINIILRSGGSPFVIRLNDKFVEVPDACFCFNDRNLHGVPQVSSERLILVVTGKFSKSALQTLANPETYVSKTHRVAVDEFREFTGVEVKAVELRKKFHHLVYAKFNAKPFDPEIISNEILQYQDQMKDSQVSQTWLKPDHFESLPLLAPRSDYSLVNTMDPKTGVVNRVPNGSPTFTALNFTKSDKAKGVGYGLSSRANMLSETWTWNEALAIPETIKYLEEELGLLQPLMCRALVVKAGGFVPFHKDAGRLEIQRANYRQINITVLSGGSPLLISYRGKLIEADTQAYSFKDLYFHGVPKTSSLRLVLAVIGIFDEKKWNHIIDFKTVVED